MKLNVFGTRLEIVRAEGKWLAYYSGNEGKKRRADDIHIPDKLQEAEIAEYIADLCHEWANPENNTVITL